MRLESVCAAASLGLAILAGCTAKIDGDGSNSGAGSTTGAGPMNGTSGSSNPSGTPGMLNLDGSPQYSRVVRLTNAQWGQAVRDVLKLSAPSGLEKNFQSPVIGTTDFSNNELVLNVNQESWSNFQDAAEALATQVTASDATLAQVYSGTDAAGFIQTVGRRAYRRPLTAAEQATYTTLFNQGASLSGSRSAFAKGASLVIRALLQSPNFLYRTELGPAGSALTGYEIAAKLSLWLRGTTPSEALLDAAAAGSLDTADAVEALATTMLGESTAAPVMGQFHGELYHFERYALISKVNVPNYDPALNGELADISKLFFDDIFAKGLGVREILTSTKGYIGPKSAALYGLAAPAGGGYAQADLGPQRVGYFSQVPFLALYGFNGDPDSIHRGVNLNLDVLCAKLGPPAATLPKIPPLMPGQTNRQRIDTLTSGCGAQCHNQMINPLGFSFEHFDGMGQYRDTENGGLPIDSNGSYAFASGTKTFKDAGELMSEMAADAQAHLCYAKKLASFALQRDVVASDMPLLQKLADASMSANGSVKQLILQLVRSDSFRTRAGGN